MTIKGQSELTNILQHYVVDVEFPNVSGAEHLEMLHIRDRLFEMEATLSAPEKEILAQADRRLIEQAAEFYAELSQFINLEQRRQTEQISGTRRWWYLDVLAQLPHAPLSTKHELVTA